MRFRINLLRVLATGVFATGVFASYLSAGPALAAEPSRSEEFLAARHSLAKVMALRKKFYSQTCGGVQGYETCFEGVGLPGDQGMPMDFWDNPVDDDWFLGEIRKEIKINQQDGPNQRLFFRGHRNHHPDFWVESATNAAGKTTPGYWESNGVNGPLWFLKRDPLINANTGIDILLSVRVAADSPDKKIALIYGDNTHKFSVGFNKRNVILSPTGGARFNAPGDLEINMDGKLNLTKEFHTFRLIKQPRSAPGSSAGKVSLYYYGPTAAWRSGRDVAVGTITPSASVAVPATKAAIAFGMVFEGVEEHERGRKVPNGQFDLDFLRFGRVNRDKPRLPPRLPRIERSIHSTLTHWTFAFVNPLLPADSSAGLADKVYPFNKDAVALVPAKVPAWDVNEPIIDPNTGRQRIDSVNISPIEGTGFMGRVHKAASGAAIVAGLFPEAKVADAYSVEWRIRFKKNFKGKHHMSYISKADSRMVSGNTYSVVLGRESIQAKMYGKPVGSVEFPHGLNMDKWQCLRFVKPAGTDNAQLYLNGFPVPILLDIAPGVTGGNRFNYVLGSRLIFGDHTEKSDVPPNSRTAWSKEGNLPLLGTSPSGVEMDYIRVSPEARAPSIDSKCAGSPN